MSCRHQFTAFALSGQRTSEPDSDEADDDDDAAKEIEDSLIDDEIQRWAPAIFIGSCVLVFTQCYVLANVISGTGLFECADSDDCEISGTFCRVSAARCGYCGADAPMNSSINTAGDYYNEPYAGADFAGFNKTAVDLLCAEVDEVNVFGRMSYYGPVPAPTNLSEKFSSIENLPGIGLSLSVLSPIFIFPE